MDEFLFNETPESEPQLLLGTAGTTTSGGTTVRIDGQDAYTTKRYKQLVTGNTLSSGDRVLLVKLAGSYVILGKIAK